MIIECPYCDSKVDGKVLAEKEYSQTEDSDPYMTSFLTCPICGACLVAGQDLIQTDYQEWGWSPATRLWPQPSTNLHNSIPKIARKSLEQAKKCFGAQVYDACAVMCGRAIEGVCAEHQTKAKNLAAGLKELRDKGIIDQRLYEWGDSLRERRNIGAHATDEDISREDARDVLEFAVAICEYVFVLSEKYSEFQARQKKREAAKLAATKTPPPPPPMPPPQTPPTV